MVNFQLAPTKMSSSNGGIVMRKFFYTGILAFIVIFGSVTPAHAYLDPGTGSIIVQTIIGSFVAVTTLGGMYFKRLKSFLLHLINREKDAEKDKTE